MSTDQIQALIARGEEEGCISLSAISEFAQEHELADEDVVALESEIEERGIELTDDCSRAEAEDAVYVNGDLAVATTDALQLLIN